MIKKQILGVGYVSLLIVIWGTFGSLVDYPLLQRKIYIAGSIGQYVTFSTVGFLCTLLGVFLFPRFIKIFSD